MQRLSSLFLLTLVLAVLWLCAGCDNPYSPSGSDDTETGGATPPSATAFTVSIGGIDDAAYLNAASVQQSTASPRKALLKEVCTKVVFAVYDDSYTKVGEVAQSVGDAHFGQASFQLDNGTYTLVVIGHSGASKPVMTKPDRITFGGKLTDTFYCCRQIEASQGDKTTLTLKRAVAMLRLVTADATPANIRTMRLYYTGGSSTFNALTGTGCVNSKQTEERAVPDGAYTGAARYEAYTFPRTDSETLSLTASALDKDGKAVFVRDFKSVPVERNWIAVLEGKFYGESADGARASYDITVDGEEWNTRHFSYGGSDIKAP